LVSVVLVSASASAALVSALVSAALVSVVLVSALASAALVLVLAALVSALVSVVLVLVLALVCQSVLACQPLILTKRSDLVGHSDEKSWIWIPAPWLAREWHGCSLPGYTMPARITAAQKTR